MKPHQNQEDRLARAVDAFIELGQSIPTVPSPQANDLLRVIRALIANPPPPEYIEGAYETLTSLVHNLDCFLTQGGKAPDAWRNTGLFSSKVAICQGEVGKSS